MIRGFVLRMAWRESRGARRRLGLLTGAVAAGVAALVAVNSFATNLRDSVTAQAQALLMMGQDHRIFYEAFLEKAKPAFTGR